jgi:hypothetical protein
MNEGPSDPPANEAARSTDATRTARYRARRRERLKFVGIVLRRHEVDALVRDWGLPLSRRDDAEAVRRALYVFLDDRLR